MADAPDDQSWLSEIIESTTRAIALADANGRHLLGAKLAEARAVAEAERGAGPYASGAG